MKKLTAVLLFLMLFTFLFGQNPKRIMTIPGTPASAFFSWPCNGLQFYQDYSAATNNTQIWRTDGTANGTFPITNFASGSGFVYTTNDRAAVVGNTFYFTFLRNANSSYELWKTDGTTNGTVLINIPPQVILSGEILANSSHIFFNNYSPYEDLYSVDNSGQVTYLARLKVAGSYHSLIEGHAAIFRDKLVVTQSQFNAQGNPTGLINLFITDGTVAGSYTQETLLNVVPRNMTPCGEQFLLILLPDYSYPLNSLAKLPGTANGGIGSLEVFYTGTGGDDLKNYKYHYGSVQGATNGIETFHGNAVIGNSLMLSGSSDNHGWELWKTDGTAAGTVLVKDIYPGAGSGYDRWKGFVINNKFIFFAYNGSGSPPGYRLFYSDGTTSGTDFFPQGVTDQFFLLQNVCYANGRVYFPLNTSAGYPAIWQTDGSIKNTLPVTPYEISPSSGNVPFGTVGTGNILYKTTDATGLIKILTALNPDYKLWNGSADNNWNNATNWEDNTVPSSSDNSLIPGSVTNYPLINSNQSINSLWINSYNTIIANNASLAIGGELGISTTNTLSGSGGLNFTGINNHTLSGGGTLSLPLNITGGDMTITDGSKTIPQLNFQTNAKLFLGDNDLIITGAISGYATDRYIVTNGNGRLVLTAIGTSTSSVSTIFPIGSSASSYTPVTLINNGTSQQFNARVINGLYQLYNTTYPESPTTPAYSHSAVNKTWFINTQGAGQVSNATVQLQWNTNDELPGFNGASISLAHYINNLWNKGPGGAAVGSGPYTFSRTGLSSFSPFAIANTDLVLPLTLLAFTASRNDNKVNLQWETSLERNTSHFIIERSDNGIDFTPIGRKEAAISGSTNHLYGFTDMFPVAGTGFYRLKMYDLNGTYKLSPVVAVKAGVIKNVELFPNPADLTLQVQVSFAWTGKTVFRISDMAGRIVQTQFFQKNSNSMSTSLELSKLVPGTYFLLIEYGDKNKEVIKFVKK